MARTITLTVCMILALCCDAFAQSADYSRISEESKRTLALTLSLDKEQIKFLDELIDGYAFEFAAVSEEFATNAAEVAERETENTRRRGLLNRLKVKRDRQLLEKRERLLDDLGLVLDESQLERIEIARLRFRRAPMFEELRGDASGFTADPIRIADELELFDTLTEEEFERFDEAMRGYDYIIETRLDKFLTIRDSFAKENARNGEETSDEAADEYIDSMIEAIIDLRSLHAAGLKRIASSLPTPLDEIWLFTALRLSHPEVFVQSWGEKVIRRRLENDDLSAEEREAIQEIRVRFEPRYGRAKVQLASEVEEAEGRVTVEQAKRSSFITRNDPEVVEARAEITELDTEARRLIIGALDPALHDLVPPLE